MLSDIEQEILELHEQNYTPREIASFLGVRISQVRGVIRSNGGYQVLRVVHEGDLPPVSSCLVNENCAKHLLDATLKDDEILSSLALVLVTRFNGYDKFLVCSYLVDYFCLGVKDTMEVRKLDKSRYDYFVAHSYASFPDGYREISLSEAQGIVYGSVEYAQRLGFSPPGEFAETQKHLGEWDGALKLQFGCEGKPLYINGPYDNPRQVIKTLESTVGRGNFDYILGIG
ncbi:helix-turn-helix transcriptional regulator [Spirulina subsalsa]|uniref:helix-turn-helix transcriptional regulator n=1 Tax=Spirulina subsalsa TaxID=54311 RepID=UPI0003013A2A|nr:hypothetical protein [Spirulina subsalsa]